MNAGTGGGATWRVSRVSNQTGLFSREAVSTRRQGRPQSVQCSGLPGSEWNEEQADRERVVSKYSERERERGSPLLRRNICGVSAGDWYLASWWTVRHQLSLWVQTSSQTAVAIWSQQTRAEHNLLAPLFRWGRNLVYKVKFGQQQNSEFERGEDQIDCG